MSLTFAAVTGANHVAGNKRVKVWDVTFDSSYPTAGESLTPANVGLSRIDAVIPHGGAVDSDGSGGTHSVQVVYDHTNQKLQAFESASGASAVFDEKGDTESLANYTVRCDFRGN